jgi:large subunit ribosomal protein L16
MLAPKRPKFLTAHYTHPYGWCSSYKVFGSYALIALTGGQMTAQQLEASRRVLTRLLKSPVWMRVFPDQPFTQKPKETRMGKGKGSVSLWYVTVKPGQVIFEFSPLELSILPSLLKQVASKLPIRVYLKS